MDNKDNKDNGMMTKIWGPPGWLFLHSVTFGYPYFINIHNKEDIFKREYYRNFFLGLGKIFPCRYCRESYEVFIEEIPIDNFLNSRDDLCYWLYLIHNKVNNKLGVPKCDIPTFDEIKMKYETYRAQCKKTTSTERNINLQKKCDNNNDLSKKGCIIPKDGIFKKCEINIITNNTKKKFVHINYVIFLFLILIIVNIIILFFFKKYV
tara:strand:+ start:65 stop:685 length:621 start_codon:yes stop_codon:yes gene_type:complete